MLIARNGTIATVYQFQNLSGMIQVLCDVVVVVHLIVICLMIAFLVCFVLACIAYLNELAIS